MGIFHNRSRMGTIENLIMNKSLWKMVTVNFVVMNAIGVATLGTVEQWMPAAACVLLFMVGIFFLKGKI